MIKDEIHFYLSHLREREKGMIYSRFWEEKTLKDIGKEWGVQKERVRQLIAKGMRVLRVTIEKERLDYAAQQERPGKEKAHPRRGPLGREILVQLQDTKL